MGRSECETARASKKIVEQKFPVRSESQLVKSQIGYLGSTCRVTAVTFPAFHTAERLEPKLRVDLRSIRRGIQQSCVSMIP
jgi:hypothetical protein